MSPELYEVATMPSDILMVKNCKVGGDGEAEESRERCVILGLEVCST